jgi:hypothetical protein
VLPRLAWGTNGVPFPGEDHCYRKLGESGDHDQCRTHTEQRAITLAREGDGWRMQLNATSGHIQPSALLPLRRRLSAAREY